MIKAIKEELEKGRYHPLYIIYGEEEYLIDQIIHHMKEQMLDEDWLDMNLNQFDLLREPVQLAVEAADTYPFGSGRRLVIAKNAYLLTGSKIRQTEEHYLDSLSQYIKNPPDFSSLVLYVPYAKLDERKKIVKELVKSARVLEVKSFQPRDWEGWVKGRVKELEIPVDSQGLNYMLQTMGRELRTVEHELEKLSLYALNFSPERKFSLEELSNLISRSIESNVFLLVERIVNQDFKGGYEIYLELMKQNEEPIMILALLARQIRIILQVKVLSQQGFSQRDIASKLKLHPFPVKLAMEQGRYFSEGNLQRLLNQIAEYDFQIKTGQIDRHLALELVLLQIAPPNKKKATL